MTLIPNAKIRHEKLPDLLGGNTQGHFHLTDTELASLQKVLDDENDGVSHEKLSDLLGGNTQGHFHLTKTELDKLTALPTAENLSQTVEHNKTSGLQGGTTTERYHLTRAELTKLQNGPATISATAKTGSPGTSATVSKSGTTNDVIFNFTIPRGDKGDKGDKGATGATGAQGIQGVKGDTGATPLISIGSVTTGTAGSNASVTKRSTSTPTNVIFDFTIPRGDKGDKGDTGSGSGSVNWSSITGKPTNLLTTSSTISASMVLGALTGATIPSSNVTGLSSGSGGGITEQYIGSANGYIKFSTGLILQYGIGVTTTGGTVTFRREFPSACYVVVGSAFTRIDGVPSRDLEYDSFTIYGWDKKSFRFTAYASGSVGCTYIAIGV